MKNKSVSVGGRSRRSWGITPRPQVFKPIYYLCYMYNDLKVKGGRLINESPKNPEMGITRIARQVKEMKKQEKVGMMRDAFYQAEMMSEAKEMIMEMKLGKKY